MTQAITDSTVFNIAPSISSGKILSRGINFNQFVYNIKKWDTLNYKKIVEELFLPVPRKTYKDNISQLWGNVPQVKLPGLEWFSTVALQKNIVSIGSTLAKTRDPKKPLNIETFFKSDPRALLLYAREIPFELVINSLRFEAIISMIPGDAVHSIKTISSTRPFNEVLDWFMQIEKLAALKLFSIEQIFASNGILKDVVIYNKGNNNNALFKYSGELYIKEFGHSRRKANDKEKAEYKGWINFLEIHKDDNQRRSLLFPSLAEKEVEEIKRVAEKKAKEIREKQQALPNLRSSLIKLEHSLEQLQLYLQQLQQH